MGERKTKPPGYLYYFELPARSGPWQFIIGFAVFFYAVAIVSAAVSPSTRDKLVPLIVFCLCNPISLFMYYILLLMIRDASWRIYVRENVLGWSRPKLFGGDEVREIELLEVAQMKFGEGSEGWSDKSLGIVMKNGEKIKIPSTFLRYHDELERAIRIHFPCIEVKSESVEDLEKV